MPTIELQGQQVHYSLRQSKRARRMSVNFSARSGFEVVYPLAKTRADAQAFFEEERAWVRNTWLKARADRMLTAGAIRYVEGAELLYLGDAITLHLYVDGASAAYCLRGGRLEVTLPQAYQADQDLLRDVIEVFYRRQAQRYLRARVHELARLHGFTYNQVRIKNQKTRWGSCSSKRNINLNLRLMMAPAGAIDYVIIHELCHLRVMNHSNAFWALVEKHCPDYREWRKWFRENEPYLAL